MTATPNHAMQLTSSARMSAAWLRQHPSRHAPDVADLILVRPARYVKTFVLTITVAATILAQLSVAQARGSVRSAALDVAAAQRFALGGTGHAGAMSEGERNLRAVLRQPDASQQLQAALGHATLAGQLYILVGLRRCDPAAYRQIFNTLARPGEDVEVMRGCIVDREPFPKVLSQIHDGTFDLFLSRPAW